MGKAEKVLVIMVILFGIGIYFLCRKQNPLSRKLARKDFPTKKVSILVGTCLIGFSLSLIPTLIGVVFEIGWMGFISLAGIVFVLFWSSDYESREKQGVKAKEYAKQLLETMLKDKGIEDYQITRSNSGFLTGDRVVFLVGFQYTRDGTENVYGYKLAADEDLTFTVMEEGTSTGKFIMQ